MVTMLQNEFLSSELPVVLTTLVPKIAAFRRDIHAHPELAFNEHRTAEKVADYLESLGLEVHRGVARTGVVAKLTLGTSLRAIGLRADMDALPLRELNTFPHHSQFDGKMHACGHDGHTSMLLGAAEALSTMRNFDGTVYFIFQPAEEHEGGGRVMVEEGLFDRFPMERVFGLHNWPGLPAGSFGVTEGPVMAGTDRFEITLTGRGGHAAMPHQTIDVVVAGSALVQALQSLVSRETDPQDAAVVSVTQFHAGHVDNVLPETARLGGTVRTLNPTLQDALEAAMHRVCEGIAVTYRVHIEVNYERGYPPTINAADATAIAREAAQQVVGMEAVQTQLRPSMGAEDFAYLAQAKPACYVWLGNGPTAGGCMLHSPHYDFNDEIIANGIRYWVRLAQLALTAPG
ncbi:MAG: M20 aminoacylase family protein [Rugosibacter sp.]|nr:M20 aminoacylase family protein [Rugosibacter sp.]MDO9273413.1 M20 aminoacylase family protein [Rugosibacter sp.]